jgi:hypothetical protein
LEEILKIWQQQKPNFIQECHFEEIINKEESLKESVFIMLKNYLDDKNFKIDMLIKDEMAV